MASRRSCIFFGHVSDTRVLQRLLPALLAALVLAPLQAIAQPSPGLRIIVIEGEDAVNVVQLKTAVSGVNSYAYAFTGTRNGAEIAGTLSVIRTITSAVPNELPQTGSITYSITLR